MVNDSMTLYSLCESCRFAEEKNEKRRSVAMPNQPPDSLPDVAAKCTKVTKLCSSSHEQSHVANHMDMASMDNALELVVFANKRCTQRCKLAGDSCLPTLCHLHQVWDNDFNSAPGLLESPKQVHQEIWRWWKRRQQLCWRNSSAALTSVLCVRG